MARIRLGIQRYIFYFVVLFSFLTCPAFAADVSLNGQSIYISSPNEFSPIKNKVDWLFKFTQETFSDTQLIEVYVSSEDLKRLLLGEEFLPQKMFVAGVNDKLNKKSYSLAVFQEIKAALKSQISQQSAVSDEELEAMIAKVNTNIADVYGNEKVVIDQVSTIGGDPTETGRYLIMQSLKKYRIGNQPLVSVDNTAFVFIKDHVVLLKGTSIYNSKSDLEWLRQQTTEWIDDVLQANSDGGAVAGSNSISSGNTQPDGALKAILQSEFVKYSTEGHPKASGVNLSISYPASWRKEEGERPHIVQKFMGDSIGGVTAMVMLQVQPIPGLKGGGEAELAQFIEEAKRTLPEGFQYLDSGKTKVDGLPAVWIKHISHQERAGASITAMMFDLYFIVNNQLVVVQSYVGGLSKDALIIKDAFERHLVLFTKIVNSVVVLNNYETPIEPETSGNAGVIKFLVGVIFAIVLFASIKGKPKIQTSNLEMTKAVKQQGYALNHVIPWRRFWARGIDFLVFTTPISFLLAVFRITDSDIMLGYIAGLIYMLGVEPILISSSGTTIGKWLFGIRVRSKGGEKLTIGEAFQRTFSVFVQGEAFNLPIIALFTQYRQYKILEKEGITEWDKQGNIAIETTKMGVLRIILIISLILLFSILLGALRHSAAT